MALRKTYLGTDNYLMGFRLGEYLKKAKPNGGTVCLIEGNAAADNILRRASGTRDLLSGKKGLDMLKGEGGWTEMAGCPVFTNDDGPKGVQAMSDILTANPKLDAFVIEGGWPLFGAPQPYRQLTDQFKDQIAKKQLVIVAADTIGDEVAIAKEGRVEALVGQRPFEMGYKAPIGDDRPYHRQESRRSGVHRARRMHQGYGGHLHPKVEFYGPAVVPRKTGREAPKRLPIGGCGKTLLSRYTYALHVNVRRRIQ